jgi:hypothetical protein
MGVLVVFILLSITGCGGSKSLYKKGNQLQEAGMYDDAADYYFNSLIRNRNNIDARIGLTDAGQRALNSRLDEFSRARAMDEHDKAVKYFKVATAYRDKVARVGIKLNIPDYMEQDYIASKEIHVRNLYELGNQLMAEKRFDEANNAFKEIALLDPDYKDIKDLKRISRNEPLYLAGSSLFDAGDYRKAYYELDQIYKDDPNYKDVSVLRNECLNLGRYPVAVLPFENTSGKKDAEKRVHAFIMNELSNLNDPFIRIVERDNMDLILKEQRLSLSGIVDEGSAAQVGNLLGAKAIVSGTLLTYQVTQGTMRTTHKNGFESYTVKLYNSAEDKNYYETRYKPVKYQEHFNQNLVTVSFQYRAVSLETGEVLFSRIVERKLESTVNFASYEGEATNLFPANPQGAVASSREKSQLLTKLRSSRELKSTEELSSGAFTQIARELSLDLTNKVNSR